MIQLKHNFSDKSLVLCSSLTKLLKSRADSKQQQKVEPEHSFAPEVVPSTPGLVDPSPDLADSAPELIDSAPGLADSAPGLAEEQKRLNDRARAKIALVNDYFAV